jgi:hypothetical protein
MSRTVRHCAWPVEPGLPLKRSTIRTRCRRAPSTEQRQRTEAAVAEENQHQLTLAHLLRAAASTGFAVADHHLAIERCAGLHINGPEDLYPRDGADGDRSSLSAAYGLGEFPWHTDGAVSRRPPEFVILQNPTPSDIPTELTGVPPDLVEQLARVSLLVRDRVGRHRRLSAVDRLDGRYRLRWDSRSCTASTPDGDLSNRLNLLSTEVSINWRTARTLVINNWLMLHRRPPIGSDRSRHLRRWYVDRAS